MLYDFAVRYASNEIWTHCPLADFFTIYSKNAWAILNTQWVQTGPLFFIS
jgi:hypothetical protein